ncbi:MAG: cytidine deaminase, partial [Ruthenibacterium sp.]
MEWKELYNKAREKLNPRAISPFIDAGELLLQFLPLTKMWIQACVVCIDTACTFGMCAERNAIANRITNCENKIVKLGCVMRDGSVGSPRGACREYLMQL